MPQLTQFRRMLGLFAFFYGCLHFLTYLWLDKFFDLAEISGDIEKRPFITIGFHKFYAHGPTCPDVDGRLDKAARPAQLATSHGLQPAAHLHLPASHGRRG